MRMIIKRKNLSSTMAVIMAALGFFAVPNLGFTQNFERLSKFERNQIRDDVRRVQNDRSQRDDVRRVDQGQYDGRVSGSVSSIRAIRNDVPRLPKRENFRSE